MTDILLPARQELGKFVEENARHRLKKVVAQVRKLLDTPASEDTVTAVHQFRVATRRYRAVLDTFRDLFPQKGRRQIKDQIRQAFSIAGEVRNRDIVLSLLDESTSKVLLATRRALRNGRGEHEGQLRELLSTWMRDSFADNWARQAAISGDAAGGATGEAARTLLPSETRRFYAAGRDAFAKGDAVSLHQFRIAAKKFRYALELFEPLYGSELEERLASLKQLQDYLGMLNDLATARTLVAHQHGHRTFHAWMDEREAALRGDLAQYWQNTLNREDAESAWIRYFATSPHQPTREAKGDS